MSEDTLVIWEASSLLSWWYGYREELYSVHTNQDTTKLFEQIYEQIAQIYEQRMIVHRGGYTET